MNELDDPLANDMRRMVMDSYRQVTPRNRDIHLRRINMRAFAASHLVRSLIWALFATTVILVADKLNYLPKVIP